MYLSNSKATSVFRADAYDVRMLYLSLARTMYACLQRAVTSDRHIAWLIYDAVHSVSRVFLRSVIAVCVYVRLSVCLSTTSCDLWRHRSADGTVPTDRIQTHHGRRRSHRPRSTASYVDLRAVYCNARRRLRASAQRGAGWTMAMKRRAGSSSSSSKGIKRLSTLMPPAGTERCRATRW